MTLLRSTKPSLDEVRNAIESYIAGLSDDLFKLNQQIRSEPEIAFQEFKARDNISSFLESQGHCVQKGAYGLPTSLEARHGSGGRRVNFNAEYDALPGLGHACGHNLIATAGVSAYLALSHVLTKYGVQGRAHLLGTPAEEDGGGKILLLRAGAYQGVDASLMIHPLPEAEFKRQGTIGSTGATSIAVGDLTAKYRGTSAHASLNPWDGVNALDALVASYNNISMLRQQIKPNERIHGCIMQAPKVTNAIPESTEVKYSFRSPTMAGLDKLRGRVRRCIEAGAVATGCEVIIAEELAYADLWLNKSLSLVFKQNMDALGAPVSVPDDGETIGGSTDMGNVSQAMPGLHAMIGVPAAPGTSMHNRTFTEAAKTPEAHQRILDAAKAMALTAWSIIVDDHVYTQIKKEFNDQCSNVQI